MTAPPELRGIYDIWGDVKKLLPGRDVCQMKVYGREGAKAILDGRGVVLGPGLHAFTDGNAAGGVGVVVVEGPRDERDQPDREIATSVHAVFAGSGMEGLDTEADIKTLLTRVGAPSAEMAALYKAFVEVPEGSEVTVVYDFEGVGKLMQGNHAKARRPQMKLLLSACIAKAREKRLRPRYVHHPGHRSSWCGRHDLAHFNHCADALATEGSGGPPHVPGCPRRRKPGV
ncbi:MAG: hypothetical protein ACRDKA_11925 [Actinomycetota bacterium]